MRAFLQCVQRFASILICALPVYADADAPKIVHIGYPKSGFLLLVRSEGTLEKRLEPLGYAVEWHEFTSGPPLLEAMNSGAVDFGHSGQPPPVFAQASGVPLVYVATTESSPDSSGLVVPQNSPIQTVADLKGKRLAGGGRYLCAPGDYTETNPGFGRRVQRTGSWLMKVFWFIPTHSDGRYLGTAESGIRIDAVA